MTDTEIPLTLYIPEGRVKAAEERHRREYEFAIKAGEHLWIVAVEHAISRAALERLPEPPTLDSESLMGNPVIGCYICEQPYERRLLHRRCPGEPR